VLLSDVDEAQRNLNRNIGAAVCGSESRHSAAEAGPGMALAPLPATAASAFWKFS